MKKLVSLVAMGFAFHAAQASPLHRLTEQGIEKIQSLLSPVAFAQMKACLVLQTESRSSHQGFHASGYKSQRRKESRNTSGLKVRFFLPSSFVKTNKPSKRYAKQESSEKKNSDSLITDSACIQKSDSITETLSDVQNSFCWSRYIARCFDQPDFLFSKTRTLFFLKSYSKRHAITLELLKKKPVVLTLWPAIVQLYGMGILDSLLQYPQVSFLVTPRFICEQIDFFDDFQKVQKIQGIVSDISGVENDSVLDAKYRSNPSCTVYNIENPLSLRHSEFLMLLSHEEIIFERLPHFWKYILGLHFQDTSPDFLENVMAEQALRQCCSLLSVSWKFGENIHKNYEEEAMRFAETNPVKHPIYCFYEHHAQKGRKVFIKMLSQMCFLKKLDLSSWFLRKNMGFWCSESLRALFLLPKLEEITLPVSLFEDKKFFSTILMFTEFAKSNRSNIAGFLGRLSSLTLNFESDPLMPAKKVAELSSYLEKEPYFHQIPPAFYQGIKEAEGLKELIFFLTRPWIQEKLTNLSIRALCFNLQNCLILGNDYSLILPDYKAQGWLKNYSYALSLLKTKKEKKGHQWFSQKDFYQSQSLIKDIVETNLQFPFAIQGLKKLNRVTFGEISSYDESVLECYDHVPGIDARRCFSKSVFLQSIVQALESWSLALTRLPLLRYIVCSDHSLLNMICPKNQAFPFDRIKVSFQKSSFRLKEIFDHRPSLLSSSSHGLWGVEIENYMKLKGSFAWDQLLESLIQQPFLFQRLKIKKFVLQYLAEYKAVKKWLKTFIVVPELHLHLKNDFPASSILDPHPSLEVSNPKTLYEHPADKNLKIPDYDDQEAYWLQRLEKDFVLHLQSKFLKALEGIQGCVRLSVFCESDAVLFLLIHWFPHCDLAHLTGKIPANIFFKNWLRGKVSREKCKVLFYNNQLI